MSKSVYLTLTTSLAIAAGAAAQCNVHRYGVPDFDQKRSGVEDNGAYHCVPTSSLNWMAYIANHGDSSLMGHSSSNWASSSEYNFVTNRLIEMGDDSNTNGIGHTGTTLDGAVDGIAEYMEDHGVNGYYIICGWKAHDEWAPSPKSFYNHMKAGELVNMVFGYYDLDGGEWERDGGHCMTVVSVENACSANPIIGFHNPNNDSSLNSQAAFSHDTWTVSKFTANFEGDVRGQWQKVGSSGTTNRRFIDKMISIIPLIGVSLPVARANGIQIHRVSPLTHEPLLQEETVLSPGNVAVVNAFPSSRDPGVFVVTRGSPPLTPSRLYFYDSVEQVWNPLATFPSDPQGAIQDRFGNIFINFGSTVQKYVVGDGSVRLLSTLNARYIVDGMAFDDSVDELELLASGRGRILSYPRGDFAATVLDRPLPPAVNIVGTPHIVYNPKLQRIYVGGGDSPSIWGLDPGAASPAWVVGDTIPVPASLGGLLSVSFTDRGIIAVLSRNGYDEFMRSPTSGQLVPVPNAFFRGRPMNGFFNLLRNTNDFDPLTDPVTKWHDVLDPIVDADSRPECQADFNFDGVVDFFDYLDYVDAFSRGDMNADFNFDGTVDFFDYLDFVDAFSNRC